MLSPVLADPGRASEVRRAIIRLGLIALPALAVLLAPAPADLPVRAQRVLAVVVLAIGLWSTEVLAAGVTSVVVIVALILTGAVPTVRDGFVALPIRCRTSWSAC